MPRWIPGQDRQHPWGKTMKKTEDMQFLEPTTSYGHWPCQCSNWTRWNPAKIMLCMVIAKTLTRNQTGNMDIVCIAIHFVGVCWAAPSGMLLDVLKFWEHARHARVFVLRASAGFLRKLGWLVALPSECIESQWIMIAVSGWRSMLDTKKNYRLCIIDCNSLHFMVVQNVFHCVSVISKTRLLECWETRASRLKNVHHQNHVRQDLVYIGNMLAL